MTITLQLSPRLVDCAQKLAIEQGVSVETFLAQAIAEHIEDQEDIAYAQETLARIRVGAVMPVTREAMEARLFGGAR